MNHSSLTFRDVLADPEVLPWNYSVYADIEKDWSLETDCLILDPNDADEDEEPFEAMHKGYKRVLSVGDFRMICANAKMQKPSITMDELFEAFLYYYDNDAYLAIEHVLAGTETMPPEKK